MKKVAYSLIENFEDWFWWNRSRKNIIIDTILTNIDNLETKKLLDIGCGSGDFLSSISKYIPDSIGIEEYEYNHKKYNNIKMCNIFNNGLEDHSFNIITALDVMEHIEDENKFLNEIKRLLITKYDQLAGGGYILITVPAYQFLFAYHDEINHHYRRYNKKRLKEVLLKNGFDIIKISYFNFFLFPPFFIVRMIDKIFNLKRIEKEKKSIFNGLLYKIFNFEKYLLRKINLPFGSSLIVLCKLKENE